MSDKKIREDVARGFREGAGFEPLPPKNPNEISYPPQGDLLYELARAKLAGRQLPPPPEGQPLDTQEDVNKYLEFAKKFPELAGKALPHLSSANGTAPASAYRNPGYVVPEQREDMLKKILGQQINDVTAERIKRQEEGEE